MSEPFDFTGVIPILATPFHDDESIDFESLAKLIRFNAKCGVDGFTILGLLGESNRLTDDERDRLIAAAVEAAQDRPVIVGTSHGGTFATIALNARAKHLGAGAVMIAPPYLPTPNEKTLFEYFQRVAEKTDLPIVLQDQPAGTMVHMSVDLLLKIANEIPSIVSVKAEALPSPQKIAAIKRGIPRSRRVSILTGLGALYGLFDLDRGSDGFNTGFAFPEALLAILARHRARDGAGARALFARYLPLVVFEQQPGLTIRKEILRLRGLLKSNRVRHPGATIDPATAEQTKQLVDELFADHDITQPIKITS